MATYLGTLDVEPRFPMKANRLIVRDNEIVFTFHYGAIGDTVTQWSLDDVAIRQPEGWYKCIVTNPETGYKPGQLTIYLLRVKEHDHKRYCEIEGFWCEKDEGAWKFSGTLEVVETA